jgi:quercetin dioxygenase-like cupin family protein
MVCYHVHADESGETHVSVLELPERESPAGTVRSLNDIPVTTAGMVEFVTRKRDPGVHAPPEREIFVVLGGMLEIETTTGQTEHLTPGDVLLLDDVGSKGHSSRDVGEAPLQLMVIWIGTDWESPPV